MSEPTDEELGIPDHLDPNIRAELRKSRTFAKEAEAARAEAEAARRELEFHKAGIPEDGIGALIRKAYDGPVDGESIRTFAAAHGLTIDGKPANAPTDEQADALIELEKLRNMQRGLGAGTAPITPDAVAEWNRAMADTKSEEDVWAVIERLGPTVGVRRHIQG